jgi:hypothetical protein
MSHADAIGASTFVSVDVIERHTRHRSDEGSSMLSRRSRFEPLHVEVVTERLAPKSSGRGWIPTDFASIEIFCRRRARANSVLRTRRHLLRNPRSKSVGPTRQDTNRRAAAQHDDTKEGRVSFQAEPTPYWLPKPQEAPEHSGTASARVVRRRSLHQRSAA